MSVDDEAFVHFERVLAEPCPSCVSVPPAPGCSCQTLRAALSDAVAELRRVRAVLAESEADEERAYAASSTWRQRWLDTLIRLGGIPEMPLSIGAVGGCSCQRFDPVSKTHTYRSVPCTYHEAAERQPWNHEIPWNCPTYFDGCNCEEGPFFYEVPTAGREHRARRPESLRADRHHSS